MNTFKIGDVVRLKSGGPKMTVFGIDGVTVRAIWFVDDSKTTWHAFHKDILELVSVDNVSKED